MNLVYGEILDVFEEDGLTTGRVRVGGALMKVRLGLIAEARPGDSVLVCDRLAIGKVCKNSTLKDIYVPGNSR